MQNKSCTLCGESKPLDDFSKMKNGGMGRAARCKPCTSAVQRARVAANPEKYRKMSRDSAARAKIHSPESVRRRQRRYEEKQKQERAERRSARSEQAAARADERKKAKALRKAAYHKERLNDAEYREKKRIQTRARKRRVRNSMPPWAVKKDIYEFYRKCPIGMTVDHIIPIKGITTDGFPVSGLHIVANFRYMTMSDNRARGNRMRQEDEILGTPYNV